MPQKSTFVIPLNVVTVSLMMMFVSALVVTVCFFLIVRADNHDVPFVINCLLIASAVVSTVGILTFTGACLIYGGEGVSAMLRRLEKSSENDEESTINDKEN